MVYLSADDYGLCEASSLRIKECIERGALNKVSVFPNIDPVDLAEIADNGRVRLSLHLNLVEGRCMAEAGSVDMLADSNGNMKHTFGGLFKLNILKGKKLEAQAYEEIRAQVTHWKSLLPEGTPFCVDSHQHVHMIPAIFRALMRVLEDERIKAEYIRIPAEPLLPFIKELSLYLTYSPINIIKQWLLKLLWLINKGQSRKYNVPTAYFFGILFSGSMDGRVERILPHYIKKAEKSNADVEVLFHPGYLDEGDFDNKNIVFSNFYLSKNRKTEYDSVIKISERRVL